MQIAMARKWTIGWLYGVAAAHLAIGVLLSWGSDLPLFASYHRLIEGAFWPNQVPDGAHLFQLWWLSLFGPSIQTLGIWLAALIYLGSRYRSNIVWCCLLLGFAVWAPQDIFISLRADAWVHVWVDLLALLSVVPPLLWLWWCDSRKPEPVRDAQGERINFSARAKRVLVTGGTGFIGQLLVRELVADGQDVIVLSRRPRAAAWLFHGRVKCIGGVEELASNYPLDIIINLAGERILGRRWSLSRKQGLTQSRVKLTQAIVDWIARAEHKPELLLTASAIGYYGIQVQGDKTPLTEQSPPQAIFMSQLCREWEQVASGANAYGVPVVRLRLGVVLGHQGALRMMLLPIKLCVGGAVGGGRQWLSWIHVQDVLRAIAHIWQLHAAKSAVDNLVYNLTAPEVVSQYQFNRTAARILHRPCIMPTPGWLVRWLLDEQADLLLEGQYVVPQKLLETGFQFKYPKLESALTDLDGRA